MKDYTYTIKISEATIKKLATKVYNELTYIILPAIQCAQDLNSSCVMSKKAFVTSFLNDVKLKQALDKAFESCYKEYVNDGIWSDLIHLYSLPCIEKLEEQIESEIASFNKKEYENSELQRINTMIDHLTSRGYSITKKD